MGFRAEPHSSSGAPGRSRLSVVFPTTVHKPQGAEFVHPALLLPTTINPILPRERVYTGIPPARPWLTLVEAKHGVLNEAVVREVIQVSGAGASISL